MKKTVQFSDKNLVYSPVPWSPGLDPDPDATSLPPSPMPSAATATFPGSDSTDDESAPAPRPGPALVPEAMEAAPPAPAPTTKSWTPPVVYSPWPAQPRSLVQDTPPQQPPQPLYVPWVWQTAHTGAPSTPSLAALYTTYPWPTPSPSPPLPAFDPVHTQIHILLAFSPFAPPRVAYDLATPPSTLNPQLTHTFLEPATYPPLPAITLRCRRLSESWPIHIAPALPHPLMPAPSGAGGFVCVLDVLKAVYTSLRTAVHRTEYDGLTGDVDRRAVDTAYFARCRAVTDRDERRIEEIKGVKRVDFLAGRTRFRGLSGPLEGGSVWELNVSE